MEFSIGQTVMHPEHGAGQVVDVANRELVEGFNEYYVIEFADKNLTLSIPMRRTDASGIRQLMPQPKLERALEILQKLPRRLPKNFKKRRKQVEDLVRSGHPTKIAKAIRDLTWRKKDVHLTKADRELLHHGRELLITELALATDRDPQEVEEVVEQALAHAVATKRETMVNEAET